MRFSVIIPARNEAERIGACLESIYTASRPYAGQTETIVVLNRCTDATGDIAHPVSVVIESARGCAATGDGLPGITGLFHADIVTHM